ncbi:MAG: Nif3-like dinuclear metal center hexameric protein [Fusobacteriaceae bacterium]
MSNLKGVIKNLEKKFPKKLAEDWDNVGLIIGSEESTIKKIIIALDADIETIKFAIDNKADLLITHHPMIFSSIKKIDFDTVLGKKIMDLIVNKINLYTLHTNIDSGKDGLNDYILEKIGVFSSKILDLNPLEKDCGIGRYFKLENEVSLNEYIEDIKRKLNIKNALCYSKDLNRKIKKVSVVNGSGASFWKKANFYGVELLVTGDVKYHDALEGMENGISFLDIGHYESEKLFLNLIEKELREANLNIEIKIFEKESIAKIV